MVDSERMKPELVSIETRRAQPVLSVRSVVAIHELGQAHAERFETIAAYLHRHELRPAGRPYVRYHTFEEHETDVEVGIPVRSARIPADEQLRPGKLPGGTMVVAWHDGEDHLLGEAYARISSAIDEGGYERNGPAWEVYHWLDLSGQDEPDPDLPRIQLVQPVRNGTA
jgi:effector-binding domain-containing protein